MGFGWSKKAHGSRDGDSIVKSLSLFSFFSAAFEVPLECVPARQAFAFALAHVHFQFVSNSGSPMLYLQQAENDVVVRRRRILRFDSGYIRAALLKVGFMRRIDSRRACREVSEVLQELLGKGEGNLLAGKRGISYENAECTFQRA